MDPQTYTVKQGDTLSKIARSYGVSVADVSGYKSADPNLIMPGERLTIGKTRVEPVNRINANDLNQEQFTPAPDVPNTASTSLQSLATATSEKIAAVQPQVDTGREEIKNKYNELGKQATARVEAYANEETVFGTVNATQKELQDINATIKRKELAHRRKVERIRNENPTGQLTEGQQIAIEKTDREWASEAADLSLVAEVKLGNYNAAKGIIDEKIDAATESLKNEVASLEFFYKENFNRLSDLQKTQLQQQTDIVKQELADTQSLVEQTGALQLEAAQNGAPAEVIMSIGKAADLTGAIQAAGKYIGLYDRMAEDGSGTDGIKFTATQSAKGAANAGMTVDEFKQLDVDTQNFYINGDISGIKKEIDSAFEEGGDLEAVNAIIQEAGLSESASMFLQDYAKQSAENYRIPTEEEIYSSIKTTLTDLQAQDYSRGEAYDAVYDAFTTDENDKNLNLPSSQTKKYKKAIKDALVDVYGRTFMQGILPGGR